MKKVIGLFMIAAVAVFMSGCGASSGDPKGVASKFAEAFIVKFDGDAMAKYATEEAKEEIKDQFTDAKGESPEMYEVLLAGFRDMKFKPVLNEEKSEIGETEASVVFDVTSGKDADFNKPLTIDLVKNDKGEWLVEEWKINLFF